MPMKNAGSCGFAESAVLCQTEYSAVSATDRGPREFTGGERHGKNHHDAVHCSRHRCQRRRTCPLCRGRRLAWWGGHRLGARYRRRGARRQSIHAQGIVISKASAQSRPRRSAGLLGREPCPRARSMRRRGRSRIGLNASQQPEGTSGAPQRGARSSSVG